MGYTTPVRNTTNRKNDHSRTRSASVPETMDAVDATNTIWKNQCDMAAWPVAGDFGGSARVVPRATARSIGVDPKPSSGSAEPPARVDAHEHDLVTHDVEGEPRDRIEADVLQAHDGRVLGAHRTRFQHREAGAHPHDQRAPQEERESAQEEPCLVGHRCSCPPTLRAVPGQTSPGGGHSSFLARSGHLLPAPFLQVYRARQRLGPPTRDSRHVGPGACAAGVSRQRNSHPSCGRAATVRSR